MFVLLRTRSVDTFPCICALPAPSYMRNEAAVPDAEAEADHVPAIAVAPPDAVREVEGRLMVTSSPVGSEAPTFAGSEPLKIFRVGACHAQTAVLSLMLLPVPLGPPLEAEVPDVVHLYT